MTPARYTTVADGRIGLLTSGRAGPGVRRHVLCFPHGGGGARSFTAVAARLPSSVALTAVDPPGRPGTRGTASADLAELVELCAEHLPSALLDGGVLLGSSVGGYAASALAARLADRDVPVRGVVMAGVVPPHCLDPARPLSRMSDEERYAWCRRLGTLPGDERESRALFTMFAAAIRADCHAYESAGILRMTHRAPTVVLGGRDDPVCPLDSLRRWVDVLPQARVRQVPGGHLLVRDQPGPVARVVVTLLDPAPPAPPPPRARKLVGGRREDLHLRAPGGARRVLPVIVPAREHRTPDDLAAVLAEHGTLDDLLAAYGAVLARGWGVRASAALRAVAGEGLRYTGGNSPRARLEAAVYTSTEYPADQEISPHNELSYARSGPARLYFACAVPAAEGGHTTLVDGSALLDLVPEPVVAELDRRGVRYVRRLHASTGPGRSWQDTFETDDRDRVTELVQRSGAQARWAPDGALQVDELRPAFATRPGSGVRVWFNQVEQWHGSTLGAEVRAALLAEFGPGGLPHEATYGDGAPIPDADVAAIRAAMSAAAVAHGWRRGDVLVVDNRATLHGRTAYRGERRVLVTMTGRVGSPA